MNSITEIQQDQELQNIIATIDSTDIKPSGALCFSAVFLAALDTALSSLGEPCKQVIYHKLAQNGLSKEAIPNNLENFTEALTGIFGDSALLLQIKIMHVMHLNAPTLKIAPKNTEFSFTSYLVAAKNSL